jgi:hypothetical protein
MAPLSPGWPGHRESDHRVHTPADMLSAVSASLEDRTAALSFGTAGSTHWTNALCEPERLNRLPTPPCVVSAHKMSR